MLTILLAGRLTYYIAPAYSRRTVNVVKVNSWWAEAAPTYHNE